MQVVAQWHLNYLLLVGNQHHEGVIAEVRHQYRHQAFRSPSRSLLFNSFKLEPKWVEHHQIKDPDCILPERLRPTVEDHRTEQVLKLFDLGIQCLLAWHGEGADLVKCVPHDGLVLVEHIGEENEA